MNNINKGTEALLVIDYLCLLDTRKDIRKHMHIPTLDENRYVTTKTHSMLQHC